MNKMNTMNERGGWRGFRVIVATLTAAAALSTIARADGPTTLWYQLGGNPDQRRIMQKDLVAPFNAAHPTTPLTLDVLAGGTGDKKIRMAVISGKGPDIVMTAASSKAWRLDQSKVEATHVNPNEKSHICSYRLPRTRLCRCPRQNHWCLSGAPF